MEKKFVELWDKNKDTLSNWFSDNVMDYDYSDIVKKVFELVLSTNDYGCEFDVENMTTIDNGDYQGTQIFIIPIKTYQPAEYEHAVTHQSYGSCSGCDALESITNYGYDKPNDEQIKDLMNLALHLVQNAKFLYESEW